MKGITALCIFTIALLAACRVEIAEEVPARFQHSIAGPDTPWTHERFDDHDGQFTFAIFSDLWGGRRDGVFQTALAQIDLLRPEIILSIGDLIDGGTEDRDVLAREWDEFDNMSAGTIAPVFYVGGNHDLTNLTQRDVWEQRYGARYYHFIYKNVLFLILDTEDSSAERVHEIYEARAIAIDVLEGRVEGDWEETEYFSMPERGVGRIGDEQADYVGRALSDNPGVNWTFVFMHKPAWMRAEVSGFSRIETLLGDRNYTVINGHLHDYAHEIRNGHDYITLGTTGGSQNPASDMAFDHITMVTMTEGGPSIGNIRVDGILDKTGEIPMHEDGRCYQASRCTTED